MNLFLLAAVPLAALALHRGFYADRPAFSDPKSWLWGAVWALVALIVASVFGQLREFTGDLVSVLAGLMLTDALLVPGLVVLLWILTRRNHDPWELGLWLTLTFTMAGIRDFAATSSTYDLNEYFLVPLDRIMILLMLPLLVAEVMAAHQRYAQWLWAAAAVLLVGTGALFQVLSFSGWGWMVWITEVLTILGALFWQVQKKAAPVMESGESDKT